MKRSAGPWELDNTAPAARQAELPPHLHVQQGRRPGQHVAAISAGESQHVAELVPAAELVNEV